MNNETISRVKEALSKPKSSLNKLYELRDLAKELCNYSMNINCGDCINEAIFLLTNWVKQNNIDLDITAQRQAALANEYYLKPINLFVQVYKSANEERQKELDECYRINHSSKLFSKVFTLTERLSFRQMFELTKEHKDSINVFANSDIYFDETILHARFMNENDAWALSRWDVRYDGTAVLFGRKDSQDVWVFNGEVKRLSFADFNFGVAGCDNRIAYEIKQAGYRLLNPSKTVHAFHLHNTNFRTYNPNDKVPQPYHFISPHHL